MYVSVFLNFLRALSIPGLLTFYMLQYFLKLMIFLIYRSLNFFIWSNIFADILTAVNDAPANSSFWDIALFGYYYYSILFFIKNRLGVVV